MQLVMTPELLVEAYAQGLFPMAHGANSDYVHWICPEERGQLPIEELHVSKSLKKLVLQNTKRNGAHDIKINTAFEQVMRACAQATDTRPETWINDQIIDAYCKLHKRGRAHSVEVWDGEELVGGLYGVALGAAFFGESMFSRVPNASKIALVHLCARLWKAGYKILDTQFINEHLKQFGVFEISHDDYLENLKPALNQRCDFTLSDMPALDEGALAQAYFDMRKAQGID